MDTVDYLDTASFKAFVAAAKAENFTLAAEQAHMTQSGISQHIAKLEERIGVPLFNRVNKRVFLTKAGEELRRFIERHHDETCQLLSALRGEASEPVGLVRYGMPHSCLFTPHFPLLLKKRKHFFGIDLQVQLIPNEEVFDRLLGQELDFGFVTTKSPNPAVHHESFAFEEYVLVGNDREQLKAISKGNVLDQPFVAYPGMNVFFNLWIQSQFRTRKIHFESLKIAGEINSLSGAITMVRNGVGITVIPKHCVADELRQKSLFQYEASSSEKLKNEIFIVTLLGVSLPKKTQTVLDAFWDMKKDG